MKNYTQFKNKLLQDREIKKAYDELGPEFDSNVDVQIVDVKHLRRVNADVSVDV